MSIHTPLWRISARLGVVVLALLATAGCQRVTPGDPVPKADWLANMLAGDGELNAIMGTDDLTQTMTSRKLWEMPDGRQYEPAECLSIAGNGLEPVYRGSGYLQVREVQHANTSTNVDLDQVVATFENAQKATAFVTRNVEEWRRCTGKTLTISNDDNSHPPRHYTIETPQVIDGVDVTFDTLQSGPQYHSQRTIAAVGEIVIDVRVTGDNVTSAQAVQVVRAVINRNQL